MAISKLPESYTIPYSGKLLREKYSRISRCHSAKVFSTKWSFLPIRESFLPRKFPAIQWYTKGEFCIQEVCWTNIYVVVVQYYFSCTNICCISFVSASKVGQFFQTITMLSATQVSSLFFSFNIGFCTLGSGCLLWCSGCGRGCGLHFLSIEKHLYLKKCESSILTTEASCMHCI